MVEKINKAKRYLLNKEGDVLEEIDKYKESSTEKKIIKTNLKRINKESMKLREETNTENNKVTKDKKLENLKEE